MVEGDFAEGLVVEDIHFHFHLFLVSVMASVDLRDELTCSICLNIFTEPVTLRCGHNFCLACIDQVLETQEGLGIYSCPECRARFTDRPILQSNRTLRNIAEHFVYFRAEEVEGAIFCTNCINSPVPAVKSCLHCESSLCSNHLRVHSKSPEHVLCDPTTNFSKRKCSLHNEVLKYFCSNDRTCICVTCCLAGDHSRHKVEPLNKACQKKKAMLKNILKNLSSLSTEAEERLQNMRKRRNEVQEKATDIKEKVTNLFTDIKRQMEILENKVQAEISRQENLVSDLIRHLEIQKNELSLVICHIEELCNLMDPLTLLQESVSVQFRPSEETGDEVRDDEDKDSYVGDIDEGLISEALHTGLSDIMAFVKGQIYVKENKCTNLDEDTVANNLLLSIDKKAVFWTPKLPDLGHVKSPVRFQNCSQVLSLESFCSGRHYWDIETSKHGEWRLGVSYSTIDRGGDCSYLGCNDKSWCLCRSNNNQYSVVYDNREIKLSQNVSHHKFRIYLDYYGGRVSFYELCSPIRHLYTFTPEFTEPLHVAFYVCGFNTFVRIGY
ncbi:E3 ubiquitin/ISG15 ligase TRIM25-like [Leptodactylus fuscus]|uniref:E3 ubiquitin/ISG15 ligase TRIM25-like n=1 Tax=Leptodactylus fuscus TaxID=238119 RepID=UPI003F4F3A7B